MLELTELQEPLLASDSTAVSSAPRTVHRRWRRAHEAGEGFIQTPRYQRELPIDVCSSPDAGTHPDFEASASVPSTGLRVPRPKTPGAGTSSSRE